MLRHISAIVVIALLTSCDSGTPVAPSPALQQSPPPAGLPPAVFGPDPIQGVSINAGDTIRDTVGTSDPACFYQWDARGRCRQFDLTPPVDGEMTATLRWDAPHGVLDDPELFVVSPDGGWAYGDTPWPERRAAFRVIAGRTYRVVVIAYVMPQPFELHVAVRP